MNLYDLTGQYLDLQEMAESGEYEPEVLADTMEAIEGEIEVKADGYAKIIQNLQGSIEAIKVEQKRLADKKSVLENSVKRIKDNLQNAMVATGKTKFKTDLFSFAIQKNGGALPVIVDVDCSDLPDDLVKIVESPDLKAIAEFIEKNPDTKLAHFGERGESLRIK